MENLSYSLSENSENTSNNDSEEENIREMQPSVRINRYIENDSENYDELPIDNKTQKNPIKKITNRKRSSKPKDSTISQKIIPKKKTIKRKSTIQRSKNDLNNEEDINSINKIPKKRRKRSISKKIENQIEEERLENNSDLQGMKAIKHTKRDLEKTAKTTKTIIRNNDSKQNKTQNLLSSYDYSTQENDHFLSRNKFLDDEDSYEYINETEISRNDQLEIEISFAKKDEENQEKETIKDPFQNSQVEVRNIKSLNYQNGELIKPNNQKQSFQPQIEEFFYDSYSRPPKLRIDTTLVAQSNNRPLLKLSQPYQVSTFSKILESESSVDNQNNEYVLRDVIIASESESDYSSKEKSKIVKTINSNNRYNLDSNTDSEVNIKQKDTFQSRYSNISAINNDDYKKDKANSIKFTKDKEFVININISDKFNTTHNSNSIDIETPKQITNSREVDLQKTNETSLSLLNDSNKLKPLPIKSKDVEIGKKLMVSPSINIQKNKYNLNVVNNYQNSSDTVIVRIESDSPLAKPTLQIHQTNSHQQYFSTINNNNSKNYNINPQSNNNTRNTNDKIFTTSNRNDSDINKNNHFNSNNNSKIPNKKDKQEDPSDYHQIHKYSNESKTHRRGDSVPRHKSSNVEEKNNNNNNNYSSQKKDKPAYEIHLHNDGSDYVGSIQFRNGKLVRRVRVRKSQRSSSVAPSNSYIRNPNNNNPYHQNIYRDNSPTKSRNYYDQNHAQYPSIGHNHHTHNQFPNDFSNYNSHHHHHYPQSEDGSNHHQRRSSSVNRIRVKKSQLSNFNPQNGKENIYSRHHNHRSNSVPRNAPSPLYTDPKNREINDSSDINVRYVFSSDDNGKRNHSEKVNVSTLTNNHSIRKEKETQTPKGKRNLTGDTFSSSSDEVLHSKSIFLDLSKIDKKEEKSAKENKNPYLLENDDNQPMISSDLEINSPYRQKKVKNHSKNWNLSQSNDMEENYSFNSQSESKKRKRKRPSSRSSSRSSISISMATPSPSASDIPTSDYEIIQTPLKDFVKNKNIFISEISSQFQEEEQENENSSFRGKNKQNGSNSKNKSKHDSISNNNKAGFAKMEKSNINNLLDIASSDDDDIKYTKKNALDYSFTDNSYKKNKNSNIDHEISSSSTSKHSHRKRKRVLNELNESSNSKSKKKKNLSQNCNSDIF